MKQRIQAAFLGQAIGDALGVPVECKSREYLAKNPVTDFMGYMCWNQPPGTFSDDSSMMFCSAESLIQGYNLQDMANKFTDWWKNGYWGARYELFDIGNTTRESLQRYANGKDPKFSGGFEEFSNGNGSLMRILPMVFYLQNESLDISYQKIKEVSSITHAHFRSVFACFIFVEYAILLLKTNDKFRALQEVQTIVNQFANEKEFNPTELDLFYNVLHTDLISIPEQKISTTGYVLDSLEASLWVLLTTNSYEEAVLKSVNLGGDTDTTAAINGGLAGLFYGIEAIPQKWKNEVARSNDIIDLATRFTNSII